VPCANQELCEAIRQIDCKPCTRTDAPATQALVRGSD